jgi:transaldolase
MENIKNLKVKIFADGADKASMLDMNSRPYIQGLTTNPTLMKKAGIKNYKDFCLDILSVIKEKPLSFEVFSDDFLEMERQANEIASWGKNVYVKIPITNTKGELSTQLVKNLTRKKIKVNVTALMTLEQVAKTLDALDVSTPSYVSVFAGRIADTGMDPVPIMANAVQMLRSNEKAELIWASPRELINVFQANEIGCQVITATSDIINKLKMVGYDLNEYSLDTVKMFYEDAKLAGYSI